MYDDKSPRALVCPETEKHINVTQTYPEYFTRSVLMNALAVCDTQNKKKKKKEENRKSAVNISYIKYAM